MLFWHQLMAPMSAGVTSKHWRLAPHVKCFFREEGFHTGISNVIKAWPPSERAMHAGMAPHPSLHASAPYYTSSCILTQHITVPGEVSGAGLHKGTLLRQHAPCATAGPGA